MAMATQELTEYERQRLENIKRNGEMLASLKIRAKASDLSAITKRQRDETKSYKVSPRKKHKLDAPVVLRRSLRTKGMPPDSKGLADDVVDFVKKNSSSISLAKCYSPDMRGPLSFKDAYVETESYRTLVTAILSAAKRAHLGEIKDEFDTDLDNEMKAQVGVSVKEELGVGACKDKKLSKKFCPGSAIKDEDLSVGSCDLIKGVIKTEKRELGSCIDLASLTLKPENIARMMPGRIMQVMFFPCTNLRMVVAGNKLGNLGFWNLDSEQEQDNGIYLYHSHSGPISGIITQQFCSSKIFTSCYDGAIRLMDAEKEIFDLVYSSNYSIFSLSQQPNNMNNLYLGEGPGGLAIWDVRAGKSTTEWLLHEARINTIDFNSQNLNIMATSSTDGTACLWDLRRMTKNPEPLKVASHKRAVHSAYFSPSGRSLATTSYDDTVGVLSGKNFEETSMILHYNQTGRWISAFRAIWGWDDAYIFIGNMKRGVDVISPAERRTIMTLQSPDISAIPCRFHAHPCEVGMLAGATGGGQVYVWSSG